MTDPSRINQPGKKAGANPSGRPDTAYGRNPREAVDKWKAAGEKVLKSPAVDRLIYGNGLVSTFIRSSVVSQLSSWFDMGVSFVLFAWMGLSSFLSTAIGALLGGILNCVINYRFAFRCDDSPWSAVVVKYVLVWIGSMLLNAYGTEWFYILLCHMTWLEDLGFRPAGYFAAARLTVSLIVSWFWNFLLHRVFVYRSSPFDRFAEILVNRLTFGRVPVITQLREARKPDAKENIIDE